jgi:hypothetical protein
MGCCSKLKYFIEFRVYNRKPPCPKLTEISMNKETFCVSELRLALDTSITVKLSVKAKNHRHTINKSSGSKIISITAMWHISECYIPI